MLSLEHIETSLPFSKISGSNILSFGAKTTLENLTLEYSLHDRVTDITNDYTIQLNEGTYTLGNLITAFNTASSNIKLLQTGTESMVLCIPWPCDLTLGNTRLLELLGFSVDTTVTYEFFVHTVRPFRSDLFHLWSRQFTFGHFGNLVLTPSTNCTIRVNMTAEMEYTYLGKTSVLVSSQEIQLESLQSVIFHTKSKILNNDFTLYVQDRDFPQVAQIRELIPLSKTVYSISTETLNVGSGTALLNTTYEELSPMHVRLEVIGAGNTSYGHFTYGGAGASIVEKVSGIENTVIDLFAGTTPGSKSYVDFDEDLVAIVAGGGGKGGSDIYNMKNANGIYETIFVQKPTGGSAEGVHGHHGFPPVHLNKPFDRLYGTGAKQHEDGLSSTESTGGGEGLFTGGHGGSQEIYPNLTIYGGSGGGSSKGYLGFNTQYLVPLNRKHAPEARKGHLISLHYGNGGSKSAIAGHTLGGPYSYNGTNGTKTFQTRALKDISNNNQEGYGPGIIAAQLNCNVSCKYTVIKYITNNAGTYTTYTSSPIDLSYAYTDSELLALLPQMTITTVSGKSYLQLPNLPTAFINDYSTTDVRETEMYRDVLNVLGFANATLSRVRVFKVLVSTPTGSATLQITEDLASYTLASIVTLFNGLGLSITASNSNGKLLIHGPVALVDVPGWHSKDLVKALGFDETYLYLYNNLYFSEDLLADTAPTLSNKLVFHTASLVASDPIMRHIREVKENNTFTVYATATNMYMTRDFNTFVQLPGLANIKDQPYILRNATNTSTNTFQGIAYYSYNYTYIRFNDGINHNLIDVYPSVINKGKVFIYNREVIALIALDPSLNFEIIKYNLDTGVVTTAYSGSPITVSASNIYAAHNDTNIVILLDGVAYYSSLSTLTNVTACTITLPTNETCLDVKWSGTQFVLSTQNTVTTPTSIFTSADGITWTIVPSNPFTTRPIACMNAYRNQIVVACKISALATDYEIQYSSNGGTSWTTGTIPVAKLPLSLTFHWPRWILSVENTLDYFGYFYESSDALSWTLNTGSYSNHGPQYMISI